KLASDTTVSLAALPLDPAQPLDYSLTGPLSPLFATYSNIQLTQLPANMSVEQCMELVGQVYANVLLGCPPRAALDMLKKVFYFTSSLIISNETDFNSGDDLGIQSLVLSLLSLREMDIENVHGQIIQKHISK
ncbi:hypothetical protein C8R48DRAFT_678377, partial [Suillus tomentosus]